MDEYSKSNGIFNGYLFEIRFISVLISQQKAKKSCGLSTISFITSNVNGQVFFIVF